MPSRDEILAAFQAGPEATVALVEAAVTTLQQEMAVLTVRIEQLQAQLNKDSHNSHQPPSSDGPGKKRTHSLRKRSGKKSGPVKLDERWSGRASGRDAISGG